MYGGARGGGKTEAGLAWLSRYVHVPEYRFLVIRRNAEDLSDWVDRARRFFIPFKAEVKGRPAEIHFPSGAIGRTGHLKDDSAYTKYQGHEYHKILIEELTHIPYEDNYLNLLGSLRTPKNESVHIPPQVFATTNPGEVGHLWVKNRFVDNGKFNRFVDEDSGLDRVFIPATVKDNPFIDDKYVQYLKGLPEKKRKAWLDGSWDVFEGQFFDEWDQDYHVIDPFDVPSHWPRYIGIDYGYSAPSAILWFAISEDGRTYCYRERYRTGLTFEALRNLVLAESAGEKIELAYVDPNLGGKVQGFGVKGIEVLNSNTPISFTKADNDRINGWARVREYLRLRKDSDGNLYSRIQFFRTCKELIRTLPMQVHKDKGDKEDLKKEGSEDHAVDALRYFVMGRPQKAITTVENKYKKMDPMSRDFWKKMDDDLKAKKPYSSYVNDVFG